MQTVRYALHNAARVFHRKNILVVFVVLFLIPFLNIGVASGYVGSIAVPEFIMDFIKGYVHVDNIITDDSTFSSCKKVWNLEHL